MSIFKKNLQKSAKASKPNVDQEIQEGLSQAVGKLSESLREIAFELYFQGFKDGHQTQGLEIGDEEGEEFVKTRALNEVNIQYVKIMELCACNHQYLTELPGAILKGKKIDWDECLTQTAKDMSTHYLKD